MRRRLGRRRARAIAFLARSSASVSAWGCVVVLGAAAPAVAINAAAIAASPSLFINDPFIVRTRLSTIRR